MLALAPKASGHISSSPPASRTAFARDNGCPTLWSRTNFFPARFARSPMIQAEVSNPTTTSAASISRCGISFWKTPFRQCQSFSLLTDNRATSSAITSTQGIVRSFSPGISTLLLPLAPSPLPTSRARATPVQNLDNNPRRSSVAANRGACCVPG